MQFIACKTSTFHADPPLHTAGAEIAHFKGFGELAFTNMRQIQLKIALDHLFEHPE